MKVKKEVDIYSQKNFTTHAQMIEKKFFRNIHYCIGQITKQPNVSKIEKVI